MKDKSGDIVRIRHIIDATNSISDYYSKNEKTKLYSDAIERNITIIGEAVRCLSDDLKSNYPEVPWNSIIGFRNILVHEYHHLEDATIWDIAENKIPALRDWVIGILEKMEK